MPSKNSGTTRAAGATFPDTDTDFDDVDMQVVYQVLPKEGEDVDHSLDTPFDALVYASCFLSALVLALYVGPHI